MCICASELYSSFLASFEKLFAFYTVHFSLGFFFNFLFYGKIFGRVVVAELF